MIDQLRRKKFLQSLGRNPAQVASIEDEQSAEVINSPRFNIQGEYSDDPTLLAEADEVLTDTQKIDRAKQKNDNMTSDMVVGASHALLGLLSGNHNRMAMEMGKANKYVSDRSKEDRISTKDLVKTNQGGRPIFTPASEAVDMEAYQAPMRTASGLQGSAKDNTAFNVYEPDTGNSYGVMFNSRSGTYKDNAGAEIVLPKNAIIKPFANKLQKTEDVEGTVTIDAYNQHAKNPVQPVKVVDGLGKHYDVATKGQGRIVEKGMEAGQKEAQSISGAIKGIDSVIETLRSTTSPRAFSAAVYQGAREVEPKGVFTEQDYQVISGGSFMPSISQLNEFISKKGTGNLDTLRQSYIDLFKDVQGRLRTKLESVPSRYAPNTKKGQEGINNIIPKAKQHTRKNQAEWIKTKSAADRRWGSKSDFPKPEVLKDYLEQEKERLGIE